MSVSYQRILPAGFIEPCIQRLYSRPGNDLTDRFPLIVEALAGLRSRSVILDGEAVACDDDGMSNFDRLRHRRHEVRKLGRAENRASQRATFGN